MVINFRTRGISRGTRKLARTSTLIKKKKFSIKPETTPEHILKRRKRWTRKENKLSKSHHIYLNPRYNIDI